MGETHDILVSFYKTAANAWTVQAHIDGADVGGTAGGPSQLGADLPLAFTGTGQLDTANTPVTTITATPAYVNGADPGSITYDFSTVTQVGAISTVNSVTNDGQGAGSIVGYETSKDGTLSAILSSGERAALGVLALKNFAHVERLLRSGNNTFQAGAGVGIETTDRPGSSGLGLLEQNTLERANVDIAEQFTSLLLYQRAYQGNSQMLNTVKDILQRTIDLMR